MTVAAVLVLVGDGFSVGPLEGTEMGTLGEVLLVLGCSVRGLAVRKVSPVIGFRWSNPNYASQIKGRMPRM